MAELVTEKRPEQLAELKPERLSEVMFILVVPTEVEQVKNSHLTVKEPLKRQSLLFHS